MDEEAKTVIVPLRATRYKCPWCGHKRKRDNTRSEYVVYDRGGCSNLILVKENEIAFEDLLNE